MTNKARILRLSSGLLALVFALPIAAAAQTPAIEKVDTPPAALTPITVSTTGRMQRSADGTFTYQWPGPYFVARFQGPALFFRTGAGKQQLHITVDGSTASLITTDAPATYRITAPVSNSKTGHTVRIDAVNENQDSSKSLGPFAVPADSKPSAPPPPAQHQIEFIGDSHTVGYGNTSTTQSCTPDQVWATTDAAHSPGALVAAHFHAEYQLNAISGRGVVRNYNNVPGDTVPAAYPYTLLRKDPAPDATRYADSAWNPSVIVLSLGTNDFSTDLHAGEPWHSRAELHTDFENTYARFLGMLRAAHPHALIILWATDIAHEEVATEARKVVDRLHSTGDHRIDFLEIPKLTFNACHGHPTTADDQTIADKVIADIDAYKDAWQ